MMSVAQTLSTSSPSFSLFDAIQQELDQAENKMREVSSKAHPLLVKALHHVLESGGKRARPAISLLAGKALGATIERLVNLASAVEMLHTATLIHDDIIDGAMFRRGSSTLNAKWSPGATILTGDYIFARAAQLAANTNSVRVISIFAETLMIICNGELYQLFDGRQGERNREAYYDRIYAKTASLFALASEAAAVLATDDEETIQAMRRFGEKLGMAFQIVDDVLDFAGKAESVGKPLGSDLRHGLVTLPTIYFLEQYPEDKRVEVVLNGHRPTSKEMETAIHAIRESKAIEMALAEARRFADEAKEMLLQCMPDSTERDTLLHLTDYVVNRSL